MAARILNDKRELLFIMSLCVTVGAWCLTLENWSVAYTTGAIGGLLIQLGNNVFANMIKNVGLFGTGVTDESDPKNQNPPKP